MPTGRSVRSQAGDQIKMINRQMRGPAGFALLRKRVQVMS